MTRIHLVLALMTTSILAACGGPDAPPPAPPPSAAAEPDASAPGTRPYDSAAETTVTGVVRSVEIVDAGRPGLHLQLEVDGEMLEIHVGPSWYADEIEMALQVGDRLDVTGSRTDDVLIARQIVRDDRTWTLRDAAGLPAWRGRGGGGGGGRGPGGGGRGPRS